MNENGRIANYSKLPNLVIGFHGCDEEIAKKVVNNEIQLKKSEHTYDWLGNGMYFWEQSYDRAWKWAKQMAKWKNSEVKTPAVIGAVIDLGNCLNLLDTGCIDLLKAEYENFSKLCNLTNKPIPKNENVGTNKDKLNRFLDCAVIESLHKTIQDMDIAPYDSVRGLFVEGNPTYDTSGFNAKTHVQLCIRNPNCIKGFFFPREVDPDWSTP